MTDRHKTRAQLSAELTQLREHVAELETALAAHQQAESPRAATLEARRDNQAHLHHPNSVAHFGRWELSPAERKVRGSAGASAIYDLPGEEWSLAEVQSRPLPEYRAMLDAALTNLIEHQQPYEVEFRIRRPGDGQVRDIQSIAEYDPDRRVVCGAIHDITAHKQAETALRETNAYLENLIDYANAPIIVWDPHFRITRFNHAAEFLTGRTEAEVVGQSLEMLFPPALAENSMALIRKTVSGERWETVEIEIRHRDASTRTVLWNSATLFAPDGQTPIATIAQGQDITARKRAEEALRASEEKHRLLIENSHDIIYMLTAEGVFTFVSPAWTVLLGHPVTQVVGQPFQQFVHPDDLAGCMLFLQKVVETGQGQAGVEYRVRHSDGSWRWHTSYGVPARDQAGTVVDYQGIATDITERKQAESQREAALEALRESEERLTRIIDFLPDATLVIDCEGKVIAWNRALEEMTGVSKSEIVGQKDFAHAFPFYGEARPILIDLIFKDHHEIEKNYDFVSKKGDRLTAEIFAPLLYHGHGAYLWIAAAALYDSRGSVVGAIESIRDITARKRAESQREAAHAALRESNAELQIRNEELDVFAQMVAHDLKNPLGVMLGYAELLAETYTTLSSEVIQETLNIISRNGRKAGNIIESLFLLASIRKQDVPAAPLDMAHIVTEATLRLADLIQDSGADLRVPDCAGWPVALGHAPWVEEIWVNYLSNALKYGSPCPRIELAAARQPDGLIRFSVCDYGPGLTPEQQQRLFAPFERLGQAQVEGYGLGLSIVRRIAEKLGGQVGVDSTPGQGSTFYFTLPAAPPDR
jgi:PAS domain S-box-containing protein